MPTRPTDDPYVAHRADLAAAVTALQTATDRDARAKEINDALAPFGESGPWKHAPESAKRETFDKVTAAQARRAGEALRVVESMVMALTPELAAVTAETQRPPSPLVAFTREHGGYNADQRLAVATLHELRLARVARDLPSALPLATLRIYVDAVRDGDVTTQAAVEGQHGNGWSGPGSTDPAQLAAVTRLAAAIREAREARVPACLRQTADALRAARKAAQLARDAHRVEPVSPKG